MYFKILCQTVVAILVMGVSSALATPACPIDYGARADLKPNKLYLFFPDSKVDDVSVFPFHGFDPRSKWLPLSKFDTSGLTNYGGTDAQLRDAIQDAVADIYCEFNVQVIATTTTTTPLTADRRNVVGIGLDKRNDSTDCATQFGESYVPGADPGDSNPVDFARIFGGYYNCADVILQFEGWTNSIAGSAAHEAAHNYGLSHQDGLEAADETEDVKKHLMQEGGNYDFETRSKPRHFSNFETSLLARNVGLAMDAMWTWNFSNPDTAPATKLRVELRSLDNDLILSWPFAGDTSPWIDPVLKITGTQDSETVYEIEWSAANSGWSGGPPGQVPQGRSFDVGATLSSPNRDGPSHITLTNVVLLDANDQPLPLQPPWLRFDTGKFNDSTRDLNVHFENPFQSPLTLSDVVVQDMQRVMSINAMMQNKPVTDIFGREFTPWHNGIRYPLTQPETIGPGLPRDVPVANRKQGRHVSLQRTEARCKKPDPNSPGLNCHAGMTVDDSFPATTVYITATVSDMSGGESHLFYQIAGRRTRVP